MLHGASGISDADIKSISLGISKINIHTELCQAAMVAVKRIRISRSIWNVKYAKVKARALKKSNCLGSDGKANDGYGRNRSSCIGRPLSTFLCNRLQKYLLMSIRIH
ncbi:class II fructose-bisphosphate aldolase [Salmonella enterica subsp. enterica]|nr:class II fructose-bisphosphate aldolase [Salmonella enterica subsp. enterica]